VFRDVDPSMRVAREEIFAPVLSIFPAHDDAEAIAIPGESEFGLAASVWASDHAHANAVAKVVDAGTLTINGGAFHPSAPYGGIKASGLGRELGVYGLEEFLEYRTYHGASA
jgi:acyl-CoA reductase-like NAD-dependent aldehyde dehydrogenase